jgi:hypothetical protein
MKGDAGNSVKDVGSQADKEYCVETTVDDFFSYRIHSFFTNNFQARRRNVRPSNGIAIAREHALPTSRRKALSESFSTEGLLMINGRKPPPEPQG